MQLLATRASPCPEFAAISVLSKSEISADSTTRTQLMGEPLMVPSPTSTFSMIKAHYAMQELHQYISSVFKAARTSKSKKDDLEAELLKEDSYMLKDIQIFHPLGANGIGVYYWLIRDKAAIGKMLPLVVGRGKKPSANLAALASESTAVIMSVAVTGLPYAIGTTSLHYTLPQRLADCYEILTKVGTGELVAVKALLTTLLLTDEKDRMSTVMMQNGKKTLVSLAFIDDADKEQKKKVLAKGSKRKDGTEHDIGANAEVSSADNARIAVERFAVLSVAESDTILGKFDSKTSTGADGKSGKPRKRKPGRDADLDNFDFTGQKLSTLKDTKQDSQKALHSFTNTSNHGVQLRGARRDTYSRVSNQQPARNTSIPALSASRKDGGVRSRRSSVDNRGDGGSQSRGSRQSSRRASVAAPPSNWSFDTGGNGETNSTEFGFGNEWGSKHTSNHDDDSHSRGSGMTPSLGSRSSRNRVNPGGFDPFGGSQFSGDNLPSESGSTRKSATSSFFNDNDTGFTDDVSFGTSLTHGGKSTRSINTASSGSSARVQVNVALNEDLTCFYKLSKMSSCSVEGVLQVQVKSNTTENVPFFLLVRDPSHHVRSIQENKKFADDMADALDKEIGEEKPDYKFTVSVPKADSYFPVLRYKCGSDLRPVPIRVQTRVRLEDNYWRVALQISSNPHNEDNLTDLTIIMGVPPTVKGETLTTSPAGGVWNASKRSVIWCVSELGGGEKFQLQARFEADVNHDPAVEEPKFPVLVRCQCMYAQLSDIEVEVSDIPEVFPADVKMKLARRFRLSHREKP